MGTYGKERYKEIIQRKKERQHLRAVLTAKRKGVCTNCLKNLAFPGRTLCKGCINKEHIETKIRT